MEANTENNSLDQLATTLAAEDAQAMSRAKIGVGIRAVLIVFVLGYMSWISGALSNLDADALTQIAADSVAEQIPEFRENLQQYAIAQAPLVTDMARDTLMQLPAQLRQQIQGRLLHETAASIERFEGEIQLGLDEVLDAQFVALRASSQGDDPLAHLDALILGISGEFRDTMTSALDELYFDYAAEIRLLNEQLVRLQRGEELTSSEQLDKQLLEVWMTLIHKHGVGDPLQIAGSIEQAF